MNHHRIVVGGFASDKQHIKTVCDKLSQHYDEDVVGMNFREARQFPGHLANLIDGHEVITHSAGFVALQAAMSEWRVLPESITAIAPPVPEHIRKLLWRGFLMGSHEHNDKSGNDHALRDELLVHARGNFAALPAISRFDAFGAAFTSASMGIPVTIAAMNEDRLFPEQFYVMDAMIQRARNFGARVLKLPGDHLRFTHDPVAVMSEIALAQTVQAAA